MALPLPGAVVGIDDEDDSTFTVTVDNKTFHFQVGYDGASDPGQNPNLDPCFFRICSSGTGPCFSLAGGFYGRYANGREKL